MYKWSISDLDKKRIITIAESLLREKPVHITDARGALSPGGIHDYYSNGDYWWPNPDTEDGLPYIVRDGETNPDNFTAHRQALRKMRFTVTHLAAAYKFTGEKRYGRGASQWLKEFFLDEETMMTPHLTYAQAIPGVCRGRGVGIIDTLHLIDVPQAIEVLKGEISDEIYAGLRCWFKEYLQWLNSHPHGLAERDWYNNHAVTWFAQAAAYARFTEDEEMLVFCRKRYKEVLLPGQMAADGSFPHELGRTKPYSYSCFVLDNMVNICLLAGTPADDLWDYQLADGRGIQKGLAFLRPYIMDKSKWPYGKDIEHDEEWPAAMPFMLFAGIRLGDEEYLRCWESLEQNSENEEIRRNIAIRCPSLFLTE